MFRIALALALLAGNPPPAFASPHSLAKKPSEQLSALFSALQPASAFSPPGNVLASGRRSRRHHAPLSQEPTTSLEDRETTATAVDENLEGPVSGPAITPVSPEVEPTLDVYSDAPRKKKRKAPKEFDVKEWAGISEPLGFFDPLGFSKDASEFKMRFYREAELKHGRVAMLAAAGFLVAEKFHPMWGGNINVPSYIAFQQTGLAKSGTWTVSLAQIAAFEFINYADKFIPPTEKMWELKTGYEIGNLGFDPLGLRRFQDEEEYKNMQTKELNNGRLAMIGIAGMVAQELANGKQLLWQPIF